MLRMFPGRIEPRLASLRPRRRGRLRMITSRTACGSLHVERVRELEAERLRFRLLLHRAPLTLPPSSRRNLSTLQRLRTGRRVEYSPYNCNNSAVCATSPSTALAKFVVNTAIEAQHDWLPDKYADTTDVIPHTHSVSDAEPLQIPKRGVLVYSNPDETHLFESRVTVAFAQFLTGGACTVAGTALTLLNVAELQQPLVCISVCSGISAYLVYTFLALRRICGVTAMRQVEQVKILPASEKEAAGAVAYARGGGGERECSSSSNKNRAVDEPEDDLADVDLHTSEERFEALKVVRLMVRSVNWQSSALLVSKDHPTILALLDAQFKPWGGIELPAGGEGGAGVVGRLKLTGSADAGDSSSSSGDRREEHWCAESGSEAAEATSRATATQTNAIKTEKPDLPTGRAATPAPPAPFSSSRSATEIKDSAKPEVDSASAVAAACASSSEKPFTAVEVKAALPPSAAVKIPSETNTSPPPSSSLALVNRIKDLATRLKPPDNSPPPATVRTIDNEDLFLAETHNFRKLGDAMQKLHWNQNLDERTVEHRNKKDAKGFGGLGGVSRSVGREVEEELSGQEKDERVGRTWTESSGVETSDSDGDGDATATCTKQNPIFDETKLPPSTKGFVDSQAMDFLQNSMEKLVFDERISNPRLRQDFHVTRDKWLKVPGTTADGNEKKQKKELAAPALVREVHAVLKRLQKNLTRRKHYVTRHVTTFMCPMWVNLHLADFGNKKVDRGYSEPQHQILYQGLAYLASGLVALATGVLIHRCHHRLLQSTWAGLEEKKGSVKQERQFAT